MKTHRCVILYCTFTAGLLLVTVWFLALLAMPGITRAASDTHTVCTAGPPTCDYRVIQDAVDAAVNGDLVKVAAGTYSDVNDYDEKAQVVYLDKTITIRGGYTITNWMTSNPIAFPTILDAEEQGRVFYITGNGTPSIEGLHITGGEADGLGSPIGIDAGGGVLIISATASLKDNYIFENFANSSHNGDGGGVYLYESDALLTNNTIISNTAQRSGGGVLLYYSAATLTNNTISANNVPGFNGDGLFIAYSPATLIGNLITNQSGQGVFVDNSPAKFIQNTIMSNLRGIFLWESNNASLYGNTISDNSAGGIWTNGDDVTISGNTISKNTAEWWAGIDVSGQNIKLVGNTIYSNTAVNAGGGGVFHGNGEIIGNTIISNTAGGGGGGLVLMSDIPTKTLVVLLSSNFILGNTAQGNGGGISIINSEATLINNIIAENQAIEGSGLQFASSDTHMIHNTITRNTGGHGSGIWLSDSTAVLTNTIIVSQTIGIYVNTGSSASLEATLWGSGTSWANIHNWSGDGNIITGTINLGGDPDFVDPNFSNYHIGSGSAALDSPINASVTLDVDFQPRPFEAPDIGADEYWPPGALKTIYLPLITG